jgi:hypothetical protein
MPPGLNWHGEQAGAFATLTGMLASLACALGGGLPLLGGPRRPQKTARVNIIPQVRGEVNWHGENKSPGRSRGESGFDPADRGLPLPLCITGFVVQGP